MVDRITSNLAREAILAALEYQSRAAKGVRAEASDMFGAALESGANGASAAIGGEGAAASQKAGQLDPAGSMTDAVREINGALNSADPEALAADLLNGEISGFHEVAARINKAKISFDFAMEVRNKLIDAYRETMRMTV